MVALTTSPWAVDVPRPEWTVTYGQKDITHDITPYVLSINYTDKLSGESDEIQIELEDTELLWQGDWYPGKGDMITVSLGYAGEKLLAAGTFSIDEIELSGPPDTVSIRGLAASVTTALRTKSNRGFESTTLGAIAQRIAKKHGLQLVGKIESLQIDRVTQYDETDLAFLKRLATEYGYMVKVTHTQIIFSHLVSLRDAPSQKTLSRGDISRFSFRDTINRIYKQARLKHQHSQSKKMVTYGVQDNGAVGAVKTETVTTNSRGKTTSGDTLNIHGRAANGDVAGVKTRAAMNLKNQYQKVASLTLPGDVTLRAGSNIDLSGFGQLSGKWLTGSATHHLDRSGGYITDLELVRGHIVRPDSKKTGKSTQMVTYGVQPSGSVGVVRTDTVTSKGKK